MKFSKEDLVFISKKVFNTFVEDPSNENENFKRVKIRNLIKAFKSEGLNVEKFNLTIKNLKFANEAIKFFAENNINENAINFKKKKSFFLNKEFFNQPEEIVFRSLTKIIKIVGEKYYPVRGKKIDKTVELIRNKAFFKITLGNCVIRKVNSTIILSKED